MSAIQRKVSTFSALHAWKRGESGQPAPTNKADEGKGKGARATQALGVHKLSPIPSMDVDDDSLEAELEEASGGAEQPPGPGAGETATGQGQGRGILKKNSVVESVDSEDNVESGEAAVSQEAAGPPAEGAEARREGLLGRFVKFDMPSFDSATSEELPEIVVEAPADIVTGQDWEAEEVQLGGDSSQTMRDVATMVRELEREERQAVGTRHLHRMKSKHMEDLKVAIGNILNINAAMSSQDMEEDMLSEEEETEDSDTGCGAMLHHTLVLPALRLVPGPGPPRRHSWPDTARRPEGEVGAAACVQMGEEQEEDEGLGLAWPLTDSPGPGPQAAGGRGPSPEWDLQGLAWGLMGARETHMV
jgi:hypothetical protein